MLAVVPQPEKDGIAGGFYIMDMGDETLTQRKTYVNF